MARYPATKHESVERGKKYCNMKGRGEKSCCGHFLLSVSIDFSEIETIVLIFSFHETCNNVFCHSAASLCQTTLLIHSEEGHNVYIELQAADI